MQMRMLMMVISIVCFLLFCLILGLKLSAPEKKRDLSDIMDGQLGTGSVAVLDMREQILEKVQASSFYEKREKKLQEKLDLLHDEDQTPEDIMKFEAICLAGGLGVTILLSLLIKFFIIPILGLGLTAYCVMMKDMSLNSRLKKKNEEFDETLPQFESSLLMAMQAGAGISKAMAMAVRTMEPGDVQEEFQQLLLETQTYTDNIALPFLNLSKRVHTKDCERFCNVVIFGLKNGNSMSQILENESEYMTQQTINRIKEKGERNSVKATAISSGLVFLPMIIIFLAPLIANTNM